jgi:RNA polymerase sigma-70 factor (ECF subfamily)
MATAECTPFRGRSRPATGHPVTEPATARAREERTDEDLARAAQQGEPRPSAALSPRLEPPLLAFLRVRTGNAAEAEELAQDAFLRAWEKLASYDSRWRFATWLFTVARNLMVSRARTKRTRVLEAEELGRLSSGSDPAHVALQRDEHENVWETATRVLSKEQRSALWLRYGEDLSIEEVADVLGRNRVTVRVILFRAREALSSHLEQEHGPGHARQAGTAPIRGATKGVQR